MANFGVVVLEEGCRSLPHGGRGDHGLRKAITGKLLNAAVNGTRTIDGLTEIAPATLAQTAKKSA